MHTVSALEHPLSAVLKDVLNSIITPVRGQLGLFRISEVSHSYAQNTLNWPLTNVSLEKIGVNNADADKKKTKLHCVNYSSLFFSFNRSQL